MTDELKQLSDDQLRTLRKSCREVLQSLVTSLNDRQDLQAGVARLMATADMFDELDAIHAKSPDLARLLLQAGVAALVNVQSVAAVDAELKRRAVKGN